MEMRADACPYRRPFPAGFDGCPAYAVTLYSPLTSRGEPMRILRTCRFLTAAPAEQGVFYARCMLGTAEQREAMGAGVDPERLRAIRVLRAELSVSLGPAIARIAAARGRLLEARRARRPDDEAEAVEEIQDAGRSMAQEITAFFERRAARFEEAGIPLAAARDLVDELVPVLTSPEERSDFSISEQVVARFPPEARIFLRPTGSAARDLLGSSPR